MNRQFEVAQAEVSMRPLDPVGSVIPEVEGQNFNGAQSDTNAQAVNAAGREYSGPERFMRALLRVRPAKNPALAGSAHRAFRASLIISAVRCLITYVAVPILVPLISFAGVVAAPIGIVLCVYAVVNGIVSVRRFWSADYRGKWMYTWFMLVVFIILGFALFSDISRMVAS